MASPTSNIFMMLRAPKNLDQPLNGRDFRDFIKEVRALQIPDITCSVRMSVCNGLPPENAACICWKPPASTTEGICCGLMRRA